MNVMNGTAGNDFLNLTTGGNSVDAGAGDDIVFISGDGNVVHGGDGNDIIDTGTTWQNLTNTTLYGDAGDDTISLAIGNNDTGLLIDGGDGNDDIAVVVANFIPDPVNGTMTIRGGNGDDHIDVEGRGTAVIDAGPGDDSLILANQADDVTLGAGHDTIFLKGAAAIIEDFNPLEDVIADFTSDLTDWLGGNPFDNRRAQLVQSGSDTLVEIDRSGNGAFDTLVTLRGVDAHILKAQNFSGFSPDAILSGTVHSSVSYTLPSGLVNLVLDGNADIDGIGNGFDNVIAGNSGNNYIDGGAGNDTLNGGGGKNVIDGGAGHDTAVFSGLLSEAKILFGTGGALTVNTSISSDTLYNIEALRFDDGTIELNSASPLISNLFYDARYADVFAAGVDPTTHYATSGWHEGRDPDAYFSTLGYLAVNADVRKAGVNPLTHYDVSGWKEGRDPSAQFDTTLYLLHNPDVAAAGSDPLAHYLAFGQSEGRQAYAAIGAHIYANGFDPEFYLLANPDVAAAAIASGRNIDDFAFQHYETQGWKEGRDPNAFFDDRGYLAAYKDVAVSGVNPLDHYATNGWREGRDPSTNFDTAAYLTHYADVARAGIDPLLQYLENGAYELRSTFSDGAFAM